METTATVDLHGADPDEVFAFLADASNNPTWQQGMRSCTWTSPAPIAVGSTYDQVATFAGREIRSSFVVTDFQPGRSITIETTKSTFPIRVTRSVAPLTGGGGARVTAHVAGEPGGLMKLLAPLTRRMFQASVGKDYRRLQEQFRNARR